MVENASLCSDMWDQFIVFQTCFHTNNKKNPKYFPLFFHLDQATAPAGRKLCISPQQSNEEQHLPAHDSHTGPTCWRYSYYFFCFLLQKQTDNLLFAFSPWNFFFFLNHFHCFHEFEYLWILCKSFAHLWIGIHTSTKTCSLGNGFLAVLTKTGHLADIYMVTTVLLHFWLLRQF